MTSIPRCGVPGTNFERTFIAIKPDGVQRAKVGNIIARFENKGYKLVALKMLTPTKEMAAGHYADLSKKPFFKGLVDYFSSGPIVAMCWEGANAIAQGRTLLGATNPADSLPGTIRGDLCVDIGRNICHGSDGPDSAKHEIEFWFTEEEVCSYTSHSNMWVYEKGAVVGASAAAAAPKKGSKKAKKEKVKAEPVKPVVDAAAADSKMQKASAKEGGKKAQDLCGMATFGVHHFCCTMEEPKGDMKFLQFAMDAANAEVDPEAEDRKGGANDIGKIFFSAGDDNLAMLCHVPAEVAEKASILEWFTAVCKPAIEKAGCKIQIVDEFFAKAEVKADPDKGVFTLKLRDECIAAGFQFLREKGLIIDDDSDDDINFADECGIDLNAGAGKADY
jgi:nucleoside-diphosphate kinase